MSAIGLIVNPVAGMGGRLGLKGTDGAAGDKALARGATPVAPERAAIALSAFVGSGAEIVTYPHEMGEDEARECGLEPIVIGSIKSGKTTSDDTKRAARDMLERGVDLLFFAGGDGTARDVLDAIGEEIPVIGIPAGVKMYSAVFAVDAERAGELGLKFLNEHLPLRESEVMDVDESVLHENRISAKLYGYLKVPYEGDLVQSAKSAEAHWEESALEGIALEVTEGMEDDRYYIIGPGSTTRGILEILGHEKTLLGIDIVYNRALIAKDASEDEILKAIKDKKSSIIVTPIGSQGFLFGRGNQQISAEVIRLVGKENIIVIATKEKMLSLKGRPLLVDTGDREVDDMLEGYTRIITDYGRAMVYRIAKNSARAELTARSLTPIGILPVNLPRIHVQISSDASLASEKTTGN